MMKGMYPLGRDAQAAMGYVLFLCLFTFSSSCYFLAKVTMPDRKDIQRLYSPGDFDFSPAPGSVVIDAGTVLPTINDDYTGRAPDLGALERGRPQPHYGPRPVQSATQ